MIRILIFAMAMALCFAGLSQFSYADVEKGVNYDHEILDEYAGNFSALSYHRIMDEQGIYQDYVYSDLGNVLELKTSYNKIQLNKSSCSFEFFNKNDQSLFIDSITVYNSVVDQYLWNSVTQVNNATCETYYDQGNDALVAKRFASGIGFMEYKYIFQNGSWKTQLEATNLSFFTDRVFAFDQSIDLNRDTIVWGDSQVNLDNFNNQTKLRAWLESNQGKLMDLLNGNAFDLNNGFDYLDSVSIFDTGTDKTKLVFHFMRNNEILMPNTTLIIDPNFVDVTSLDGRVYSNSQTGSTCHPTAFARQTVNMIIGLNDADVSGNCSPNYMEFNISAMNSTWIVHDATLEYDVITPVNPLPRDCEFRSVSVQGSTGSIQTIYDDAMWNGVILGDTTSDCWTVQDGNIFNFNATGIADLQTAVSASQSWYTIGSSFANDTRTSEGVPAVYYRQNDAILTISYSVASSQFDVDINAYTVGDATKINGTVTLTAGSSFPLNLDSIELLRNGTQINLNSTNGTFTGIDQIINFGPLWNQMTTDDVYNFTAVATVDNATGSQITNSSQTTAIRGYAPDYFTAIDPTQGMVNYTFVNDNFMNVNRNTSSVVFNVECQYFTQAQAFLNDLASGVWDNKSNVLYYVGDTSGYYYVQCYNDGELFVTAISQNYANSLVPGLVIFDQLGGFFGAPSIVLVILSILSLGTGRNYPIVLLITASVTGILLALELITLDPGLVVALIVMAGIGLFGIRKFY